MIKKVNFYRISGFKIISNGVQRFLYKNNEGRLIGDPWGGVDVIYIEGSDGLIKKSIRHPLENAISYREHWL